MASTYRLLFDGAPGEDLANAITSLEVEENAELPGAIELTLPISAADDDLTFVNDERLKPFANIAVVAAAEGGTDECIFDGYVLSHKLHLETGVTASVLKVWGQDASWLMNLEEKAREWVDVSDSSVAASIFGEYGISPSPNNTDDDSPVHTEDVHSLMQRGSDSQFLRSLARRNGKLFRVACEGEPGTRIGYFCVPQVEGEAAVTLKVNDTAAWNVGKLDIEWDVTRPTTVQAGQKLFTDTAAEGVSGDASASGLAALDSRDAATFMGRPMVAMLTAPVGDGGELALRAQSLLREAGWFVRAEGETDVARLNAILRVGRVVQIEGIGTLNSGKYYVWSVRHTITADAHTMRFVLMRNAVGESGSPSGGLLGGIL
jgi:phage protein D